MASRSISCQALWLTLFLKGEMFSTDAAFKIGTAIIVKSASRVGAGIYKVVITQIDEPVVEDMTLTINVTKR